jgi:eukaryotic-like serine/threonine-protein kinase
VRCGNALAPASGRNGNANGYGEYGEMGGNDAGYSGRNNEPIDGVWREEWPSLGGTPSQTPMPPWLAANSAPAPRMPSSPYMDGGNAPQSRPREYGSQDYGNQGNNQDPGQQNGWGTPSSGPLPGQFASDYPSQYPSYFGPDSQQLNAGGVPQQQQQQAMPPMFMVNPPEVYPSDTAVVPYGLPPSGPLSTTGGAALTLMPALSPGTALKNGRYRIIQRFSSGAPGSDTEPPLMVATDTELPSEQVLVQELPLGAASPEDAEFIRHGVVERLDALSRVAGVAHLRDNFVEQRRHFLVFELPSGDRLIDRMRRAHGPLPETTVIGFILRVLEVLSTLQRSALPIIHGNITPANIILRPNGQVALVGFSPMLLIYPTGQVHGAAGALTHYSAPEQARGTATVRSDLYATCAVMHHAVTGVEPVGRMFPLARHANPAISLELEDILGQGLRPSPSQRFQTPESLREELAPLLSGRRLTHVDEELDPSSPTGLRPLRDAQGRLVAPRQRLWQNPLLYIGSVLLLIVLLGGGVLYNTLAVRQAQPTSNTETLTSAFASYYQSKGIGLSGGEFVFDTNQPDYALKQKGALALGAGDIKGGLAAYRQAVASQPDDAEALIYAANLQILVDNAPYITIIAGVAFGSDDDRSGDGDGSDVARYEMQGIYLAQQRFNTSPTRPNNLRLRVLILNSGAAPLDAQLASSLTLEQIRKGNVQHIVGVIGWPGSNQTRLAMAALGASGLPVLSPTASADNLDDTAGNFYSLVPSDSQQAINLANAAVNNLQARRVLVAVDAKDQEEGQIATSFSNHIVTAFTGTTIVLGRASYDETALNDASAFKDVAAAALAQNADLIFLVGNQRAAILLADAVSQQAQAAALPPPHILVGAQTVMTPFLGIGTDPAAQAGRANPNALGLIYVASLASISAWQKLNMVKPDVQAFSDRFASLFGGIWGSGSLSLPGPQAILAYDATNLLISASASAVQVTKAGVVAPVPAQLNQALAQFTAARPFVGFSGAVGFAGKNHQPNKALGIYMLLPIPNAPSTAAVAQIQLLAVVGGKNLFCGQSTCDPY